MIEEFGARHGFARTANRDVARLRALLNEEEGLIHEGSVSDYLTWLRLNLDLVMARAFRLAMLRNSRDVHVEHRRMLRGYERRDEAAFLEAVRTHLVRGRDAYAAFAQPR